MIKILVTGSQVQLGSEIREEKNNYTNYHFIFSDITSFDITKYEIVEEYVKNNNIECIINCAAYTNVEMAQEQQVIADEINHLSVNNLARISKENDIKLIHISTDYVFDGKSKKPYLESDTPNPKSVYGLTKYLGEQAILRVNPKNSIIIRTSWVYSSFGSNFVKTILKIAKSKKEIKVVDDQIGSPTYAKDLAKFILEIIPEKNKNTEIINFSNGGTCSWFDFSKEIIQMSGINSKIKPVDTSFFNFKAPRPKYSVLDKSKLKTNYNFKLSHWKKSLETFFHNSIN